jgi:uncharacterized membrane protein
LGLSAPLSASRLPAARKIDRSRPAPRRIAASAVVGGTTLAAALAAGAPPSVTALVGWDATALVFLTLVWLAITPMGAAATAASAQAEDASRTEGEAIFVGAGTASLVAVGFTLVDAGRSAGAMRISLIALAVVSVVLAWASVHTVYALRYARLYYAEPVGGIDFNGDDAPSYLDFVYVALTVGMTSQVSDTSLTLPRLRRTAIHHALLAYLFAAVVVALMINIVASLLRA